MTIAGPGEAECATIEQDWLEPGFSADPYPSFERWRAFGPVVYNAPGQEYLVTGFRNCQQVLRSPQHFSSEDLQELFIRLFGGITMEAIDTPRHHEMRGVWAENFERRSLESTRATIEQIVAPQVDAFVERVRSGEVVDAIPNMTRAVPTLVIAQMLGIDDSMHGEFSAWSDAMGATQTGVYDLNSERGKKVIAEGRAGTAALNDYMASAIRERRAHSGVRDSGDDLVSIMVNHDFAKQMSDQEIIASNTQLVFAGNETTAKLMASVLVALGQHPDQRRLLTERRSLIPQAVEEIHRWQTIVQTLPRRVISEDAEVQGVPIPCGSLVRVLSGAANRDPERWQNADVLDITREPRMHLGFGFGMHVCIGVHLARLELEVWLNQILDKLPEYQLAGEIEYGRSFALRAPVAVPIAV
jgi:cytochrome P450